jgi:hypothetical protein
MANTMLYAAVYNDLNSALQASPPSPRRSARH